jgi:outer membrane protein assembly factor BamB
VVVAACQGGEVIAVNAMHNPVDIARGVFSQHVELRIEAHTSLGANEKVEADVVQASWCEGCNEGPDILVVSYNPVSNSGTLWKLDEFDLSVKWSADLGGLAKSHPYISNEKGERRPDRYRTFRFPNFYAVGTYNGDVVAVDDDGKELWRTNVGFKIHATPVRCGDYLIVCSVDHDQGVVALDMATGSVEVSSPPPPLPPP